MWRCSQEEWERRKTYLIRSLFEDLPLLSPISECQEHRSLSPNDEIYRTESPLPDLIIEKEPKKYLQDETEEFYNKLAKEMRKLYKRDFLNVDDTVSCESVGLGTGEDSLKHQGSIDVERTLEPDTSIQEADLDIGEYLSQITSDDTNEEATASTSIYTESTGSEESVGHEQIITQADVHTAVVRMSKRSLHDRIYTSTIVKKRRRRSAEEEEKSDTTSSFIGSEQNKDTETNEMETAQEVLKKFAKTTEASTGSSSSQSHDENNQHTPEIMRRRQTIFSENSLPYHELPIWENSDKDICNDVAIEITNETFASGSEMEATDSSLTEFNMLCTVTSTPKSLKRVSSPQSRITKRYKRLVSYSSSSSGSRGVKRQVALQTSFSDDEPAWKNLWSNFFVGVPIVYNICSCKNHVCS